MRRWHQERRISLKNRREHHRFIYPNASAGCDCDRQVGRFRKQHGLGCRRAHCQLSHFEKIHQIKGHHERLADLRFR
jgi:hypothetical protein